VDENFDANGDNEDVNADAKVENVGENFDANRDSLPSTGKNGYKATTQ
jgi:hypothetical protein